MIRSSHWSRAGICQSAASIVPCSSCGRSGYTLPTPPHTPLVSLLSGNGDTRPSRDACISHRCHNSRPSSTWQQRSTSSAQTSVPVLASLSSLFVVWVRRFPYFLPFLIIFCKVFGKNSSLTGTRYIPSIYSINTYTCTRTCSIV